jgi:hypothetical protein
MFKVGDTIETYDDSVAKIHGKITHAFKKGDKVPSGLTAYGAYDKVGGKKTHAEMQEFADYADSYVIDAVPADNTDANTVPVWVTHFHFVVIKKV